MASSLLVAPADYSESVGITLAPSSTTVRALSPGPAPTRAGESSSSGSGSNKDIVGIAVGSAVGGAVVLVGLGILLWVCCRRRRLNRSDSEESIAHGRNSSKRGAPSALTRSSFGSSYPSGLVAPEPRSLKSVSPGGAASYRTQPTATGSPSTPSRPSRPARSLRSSLGIIIPDSPPSKIRVPPPHVTYHSYNSYVDDLDSAPRLSLPVSMAQHPNASQSSLMTTPSDKWLNASPRSGNTGRSGRSAKRVGQARLGGALFQDGTEQQQAPLTPPPRAAKRNSRFVQV
ncbi:hypothetical protein Q8F55_004043 [Vanrija albida]|uniref:Uncharacterized protein n=1 Tax=Vanrija albida TaxID=181172 RepID=A0ABR3Q6F7_9TREE